MSKDDRDLPEDFDADVFGESKGDEEAKAEFFERTRSSLGPAGGRGAGDAKEPRESFDELLSDLSGKMVEGGLANRLRGVMQRGASAGREIFARGRRTVAGVSSDEASSGTSGVAAADGRADGQEADAQEELGAAVRNAGESEADELGVSKNTRDFMASLEERFPGVKSSMLPPPPPKDFEADEDLPAPKRGKIASTADLEDSYSDTETSRGAGEDSSSFSDSGSSDDSSRRSSSDRLSDRSTERASNSSSERSAEGVGRSEDAPDATSSDIDADEVDAESAVDEVAAEPHEPGEARLTENVVSMSRKFIADTAAKIAAASAAREQARRERREAREAEAREAEARALAEATEAAEPPVVEETGWGDPQESRPSALQEDSKQAETFRQPLAQRMEGARASFDDDDATEVLDEALRPAPQKLRRAGDTDSLEPINTGIPSRLRFTRRGKVIKLSSGTKVLQNSMQSVRSTVNALNSGQSIDPTRPTIALFAALILGATIIASSTLLSTGTLSSRALWGFSTTETEPTEVVPTEVIEEETTAPAPAPGAPKISSIDVISYNGDDGDHPEWAEYMFDGDQGSRWQSRYFAQPELPQDNRIKLIIHLEEESTVSAVTFYGPIDGGQVDLRVNDGADPFGTPVLTSSKMALTTTLKPTNPAVGTTVTLDFVALPIEDEGQYRVKIDELSLQ
ncbi:MAG: hypothetical protein Q4E01_00370 [Actinomycetaceae bacterium]|nr:hypothetical protein [Actinomycetaceae bacterium]